MGVVFFAIVKPTSLIMKILGKNLLHLKKDNKKHIGLKNLKFKVR